MKRYHGAKLMMEDSVFAELQLFEASRKFSGVRVRQHVNPLKSSLQRQLPPPDWAAVFANPHAPLTVDIGCGGGRFDLLMARRYPNRNFLGVDIRAPLITRGNQWSEHAGLVNNLHFAEANATVCIGSWIAAYQTQTQTPSTSTPAGVVDAVSIQFPDPHFKRKHHKRRVVQPSLVMALAAALRPGAAVFLQSDVRDVAVDMRDKFEKWAGRCFILDPKWHTPEGVFHDALGGVAVTVTCVFKTTRAGDTPARKNNDEGEGQGEGHGHGNRNGNGHGNTHATEALETETETETEELDVETAEEEEEEESAQWSGTWAAGGWCRVNPLGVPTEREVQTLESGAKVYRVMLVRNDTPAV